MDVENLFADIPDELPEERIEPILQRPGVRIERIVSRGHASPEGFWYDPPHEEWVLLLSGRASLQWADRPEPIELAPGDHLLIPAHARHRVEWTDDANPTVWLAVHLGPTDTSRP